MSATLESAPPVEQVEAAANLNPSRAEFLRRFGGLMLAPVVAGYVYEAASIVNTMGTAIGRQEDERWPKNEPSFTWLGGETNSPKQRYILYLPGFGEINPEDNAADWFKASNLHDIPMGYMDYSNQGTTLGVMARLARRGLIANGFPEHRSKEPKDGPEIHVLARSIGGLYTLPFLAELDLPVKSITFISSPSRLEYGDFGNLGSFMAGLPKWRAVDTMAKTMVNAYRDYEQRGFNPSRNMSEGWRNTMYGADPTALHQELRVGKSINVQNSDLLTTLMARGIIVQNYTEAIYSATYKPATDITVHVRPSEQEYEKALRRMKIALQIIPAHYEGHAHILETAERLLHITQSQLGLAV